MQCEESAGATFFHERTAAMSSPKILLFGAGKMGGAMLEGWLKDGVKPADVTVIDPIRRTASVRSRRRD